MKIACPVCKKEYTPELSKNHEQLKKCQEGMLVQNAFPHATAIQREQLVTGICSDQCWDNLFKGVNGD